VKTPDHSRIFPLHEIFMNSSRELYLGDELNCTVCVRRRRRCTALNKKSKFETAALLFESGASLRKIDRVRVTTWSFV
jgi:hypothetical protein